jgi:hypothetical protein
MEGEEGADRGESVPVISLCCCGRSTR